MAIRSYTHDFAALLIVANLKADFETEKGSNADLAANWGVVKDWAEKSRYERWTLPQAQQLYDAIVHPQHGVLTWFKARW